MSRTKNVGKINWRKFGKRVGREIAKTGLSYRKFAREIGGPTAATWHKIAHGKKPVKTPTYLWLCRKFGIDPFWAFNKAGGARVK